LEDDPTLSLLATVQLVDLATGLCTAQPRLPRRRAYSAAAQLPDGRDVCAGGVGEAFLSSAEVWGLRAAERSAGRSMDLDRVSRHVYSTVPLLRVHDE
jgi:hypothetical protein